MDKQPTIAYSLGGVVVVVNCYRCGNELQVVNAELSPGKLVKIQVSDCQACREEAKNEPR